MEGGGDRSSRFGFGTVCVTGGTGFFGSWLIFKLLEHGYSVNTTVRSSPDGEKDVSYLLNLPGASERLKIFKADLDIPDSFNGAIEGCVGVFHVAHPIDALGKETEEQITRKAIDGMLGILHACLRAKTVKRVVYTSSATAVMFNTTLSACTNTAAVADESTWSDLDHLRGFNSLFGIYSITKTLSEKAALDFADAHGLDIVTIVPTWITGPFICPNLPRSVRRTMALIFGDQEEYKNHGTIPMVHTDDLARAHIHLFQHPDAKGRYICSAVDISSEKLREFLSARYQTEFQIPSSSPDDSLKDNGEEGRMKCPAALSSKKLLDTGFRFKYGLEEIYDEAIKCCKEKKFL